MSKIIDIIGMKFGRLTVVERCEDYIQPSGQHIPCYLCRCDCEKDKFVKVRGASLRNGMTKSCGCLRKEVCSKRKGYNQYDFYDDYVIGYTSNGEPFIFDVEDYEKIKDIHWYINKNGYVVSTIYRQHRLIMDCPDNMIVDHINHNKADNRKCNLRITTQSENSRNVALRKNNKSGVTGVYWSNHFNKWIAKITIDKKESTLGMFDVFEEAVTARKNAELKYYGDYSYEKSQLIQSSRIELPTKSSEGNYFGRIINKFGKYFVELDDGRCCELDYLFKLNFDLKVLIEERGGIIIGNFSTPEIHTV